MRLLIMTCWCSSVRQAVSSLKKNFPDFDQKEIKIGTFGSTTAQAVRDAGLRLDLEAPTRAGTLNDGGA